MPRASATYVDQLVETLKGYRVVVDHMISGSARDATAHHCSERHGCQRFQHMCCVALDGCACQPTAHNVWLQSMGKCMCWSVHSLTCEHTRHLCATRTLGAQAMQKSWPRIVQCSGRLHIVHHEVLACVYAWCVSGIIKSYMLRTELLSTRDRHFKVATTR